MELYSMLYAGLDRRGVWGRKDMCICMARSLQCAPETASTMWIGSPPIQNKKFKVCGGKAWRKHLYIHVTNHRTCPKLDTQYRSNEWMGSDFLTSKPSRMIPWPMCLGSLEWDASQPLPSLLSSSASGYPPSPTLPAVPKVQLRRYESWRNCQEIKVSLGITFILISPS